MSLAIAGALESGQAPELAAAVVKDLGTRYENEVIDAARLLVAIPPDPGAEGGFARLLADAVLHAPGLHPARAAPTRCCAASSRADWDCDERQQRPAGSGGVGVRRTTRSRHRGRFRGHRVRRRAVGDPRPRPASPGSRCRRRSVAAAPASPSRRWCSPRPARTPPASRSSRPTCSPGWLLQAAGIALPDGPLTLATGDLDIARTVRRAAGRAAPGAVGTRRRPASSCWPATRCCCSIRPTCRSPTARTWPRSPATPWRSTARSPRPAAERPRRRPELRLRAALGRGRCWLGARCAARWPRRCGTRGSGSSSAGPIGRFQAVQQQLALAAAEVAAAIGRRRGRGPRRRRRRVRAASTGSPSRRQGPHERGRRRRRPDRPPGARRDRLHPRARPAPGHHAAVGLARRGRVRGAVARGRRGGRAGGGRRRAVAADHRTPLRSPVRRESGRIRPLGAPNR